MRLGAASENDAIASCGRNSVRAYFDLSLGETFRRQLSVVAGRFRGDYSGFNVKFRTLPLPACSSSAVERTLGLSCPKSAHSHCSAMFSFHGKNPPAAEKHSEAHQQSSNCMKITLTFVGKCIAETVLM